MASARQTEQVITTAQEMDRAQIISQLLSYQGRFPVDFTAQYLADLSLDRLRHLLVALQLQNRTNASICTAA